MMDSSNKDRRGRSKTFRYAKYFTMGVIPVVLCVIMLSLSVVLLEVHQEIRSTKSLMAPKNLNDMSPNNIRTRRQISQISLQEENPESIDQLRERMPPSVWTLAGRNSDPAVTKLVAQDLNEEEKQHGMKLCGKFLYSTIERAVNVADMGEQTFVATGDIDSMWTRDSAVQMGIYVGRMAAAHSSTTAKEMIPGQPYLRPIVEGAIRRQAFNIIQDPYANAYSRSWKDPSKLQLKQQVIGRGGWVDTRNYEVDSGAYFFTQLFDYYVAEHLYRPELLLAEPIIYDAVVLMVETYIVEQHHEARSPYRYFEIAEGGKGLKTGYTGMTWSGFRPSDDKCKYGYLVPSNIHAAAGLERILELNKRIWKSDYLHSKASKLLAEMEDGIRKFGVIEVPARSGSGTEKIYAYEVDGLGQKLTDFDDANVPSLLSIPILGWSKYDPEVYRNTRARLLDPKFNRYYYEGEVLKGMGSPHTPNRFVWSLAFAIEALTEEGTAEHRAKEMAFQVRQSLTSACDDAMHEGVSSASGCPHFSRPWFEWANALFVVLMESALGERCDEQGRALAQAVAADKAATANKKGVSPGTFYENRFKNDHTNPAFYQGIKSKVKYVS